MATGKLLTLVTGANTGLGYYIVQQLSATGKYHILLGSRNISKAKDAIESLRTDSTDHANIDNIEPIQIDVSSDDSIAAAAQYVQDKYGYLDILINNAGISKAAGVRSDNEPNGDGTDPPLREQYRQQYDTNVFGAAVTTDTFLPLLRKSTQPGGKRINFTGSSTGSLALALDPPHPNMHAKNYRIYRSTKSALNMLVVSFARELEDEGFVVSAGCPGYCATNLNNKKGFKHPRDGAKVLVDVMEGKAEDVHARLSNENGAIAW